MRIVQVDRDLCLCVLGGSKGRTVFICRYQCRTADEAGRGWEMER